MAATSFRLISSGLQYHTTDVFISHSLSIDNNIKSSEKINISHTINSKQDNYEPFEVSQSRKWRTKVSLFTSFLSKDKESSESIKQELLQAIATLDRGAEATNEDQDRIDQLARELEAINRVKEPLKSNLVNGKWELLYTTSKFILQTQAAGNLIPLSSRRMAVKFNSFKIAGLIPKKSRGTERDQLEIIYLDDELRISRGNQGNLFILRMVDRSYRVAI